jgi:23S rRNA (uracil1939-C5)-methyltransferase
VAELYAGAGNLTLPLALSGAVISALEVNAPALDEARKTLAIHGREGRFLPGPVWKGIDRLVRAGDRFEILIADPPRTGMGPDAAAAARLGAPRVVLCSCEPSTLARDLRPFLDAGYTLDKAVLVDMFPQTWHMETVLLLTRTPRTL